MVEADECGLKVRPGYLSGQNLGSLQDKAERCQDLRRTNCIWFPRLFVVTRPVGNKADPAFHMLIIGDIDTSMSLVRITARSSEVRAVHGLRRHASSLNAYALTQSGLHLEFYTMGVYKCWGSITQLRLGAGL